MKKFQVIEESRFLDKNELNQIKGGMCKHTSCTFYEVKECMSFHACGSDWWGGNYTSCNGSTYQSCTSYKWTDLIAVPFIPVIPNFPPVTFTPIP